MRGGGGGVRVRQGLCVYAQRDIDLGVPHECRRHLGGDPEVVSEA